MMAGGCILLFVGPLHMLPMNLALMVLFFRWGKDLWFINPDTALIKGWAKSLIYIGVHIGLVVVCGLIGVAISIFFANGSPGVANWNFLTFLIILGLWIHPNKFIPRHKTIPEDISRIGNWIFADMKNLKILTIGDNIKEIGEGAFAGCTHLISVYCKATTPPTGRKGMFSNNAANRKIYVPRESVEAYKTAEGWKKYADDIVGYDF